MFHSDCGIHGFVPAIPSSMRVTLTGCVSVPFHQGMGIESHDDRSVFKRELKNLKPFADKQRKAMEKLKREEKKIAKKLKKK